MHTFGTKNCYLCTIMRYTKKQMNKIFTEICDLIIQGESLRSAIVKSKINRSTFFDWTNKYKDMADQYARAMEIRAEILFDEMIEIADTPKVGVVTRITKKGIETETGDMLGHRKLQIDARKWALSKMMPKKFGAKTDDNTDIGDSEIIIKTV